MALSDKDIEDLKERILKINDTYGMFEKSLLQLDNAVKSGTLNQRNAGIGFKNETALRNRIQQGATQSLQHLTQSYKDGNASFGEVRVALQEFRDKALAAAGDNDKLRQKIEADFKVREQGLRIQTLYNKYLSDGMKAASTAVGGLVSAYQKSSGGLEAALNFSSVGLTLLTTSVKAAGKALSSIPFAGAAIEAGMVGLSDTVMAIKPVLDAEVLKLAGSFKTASESGMIFANGVSGLQESAYSAGLTTDLFAQSMKDNSEAAVIFGGNMTAAASKIGKVSKLVDTESLQKLGFNLQEIPGLIAQTGARLAKSGTASDAQVAKATMDYAKNLRIIADITGQDAKTLMQKQEIAEKDLAYQQFLAEKSPAEADAMRAQMMALPESVQAMAKEMMVSGGVLTTQQSAMIAQQVPAYKAMADAAFAAANSGTAGAETGVRILKQYAEAANAESLRINDFARAGSILGGEIGATAQAIAADRKTLLAAQKTNVEELIDTIKKGMATTDPTTTRLAESERDGMVLMIKTQQALNETLPAYLTTVNSLNVVTLKLVQGFSALVDLVMSENKNKKLKSSEPPIGLSTTFNSTDDNRDFAPAAISQQRNINTRDLANFATIISGTPGGLDPDHDTPPDALAWLQAHPDDPRTKEFLTRTGAQLARGGIVDGPTSGFPATLHGSEAVIPLPDGISGPEFAQTLQGLSRFNNATSEAAAVSSQLREQVSNLSNDLLTSLSQKMDDLIDATQDVVRYTKETSVRIM